MDGCVGLPGSSVERLGAHWFGVDVDGCHELVGRETGKGGRLLMSGIAGEVGVGNQETGLDSTEVLMGITPVTGVLVCMELIFCSPVWL